MKRISAISILFFAFLFYSLFFSIFVDNAFSILSSNKFQCKSEQPLYVKIALNEDASKVLSVVFDEENGTGKGYNLLYADIDFKGNFENTKRLKSKRKRTSRGEVYYKFKPIELDVPYNSKDNGGFKSCRLTFISEVTRGKFKVIRDIELRQGFDQWEYSISGDIKASENLENASVWSIGNFASLSLDAKPDKKKERELGIGLDIKMKNGKLEECKKGSRTTKAHIVFRNQDGETFYEDDEEIDKVVPPRYVKYTSSCPYTGTSTREVRKTGYSVKISKDTYNIEITATVDTGPLFGVLEATKTHSMD